MASSRLIRIILGVTSLNALLAGAVLYNTNQKLERNHEEAEARMDELEGTLRGHIGLIEESLERLEGRVQKDGGKGGWGQGPGPKTDELYQSRGKDGKR